MTDSITIQLPIKHEGKTYHIPILITESTQGLILEKGRKWSMTNDGYPQTRYEGKSRNLQKFLLMVMNVPNPENKNSSDHINGQIYDNRMENLRWATRREQGLNQGHTDRQVPRTPTTRVGIYRITNPIYTTWRVDKRQAPGLPLRRYFKSWEAAQDALNEFTGETTLLPEVWPPTLRVV